MMNWQRSSEHSIQAPTSKGTYTISKGFYNGGVLKYVAWPPKGVTSIGSASSADEAKKLCEEHLCKQET